MGLIKRHLESKDERDSFISLNEAIGLIKSKDPEASLPDIAKALFNCLGGIEEVCYNDFTNKILSSGELNNRQFFNNKEGYTPYEIIRTLWLDQITDLDSLPFPNEHDIIGWYKKDFYEALKHDGFEIEDLKEHGDKQSSWLNDDPEYWQLDIKDIQRPCDTADICFPSPIDDVDTQESNVKSEIEKKEPPAWFKPKHLMPYLDLYEASFIIALCEEVSNHWKLSRSDLENGFFGDIGQEDYRELLRQAVEHGRISLSPNHGNYIDHENYWKLNVMDIREFCHETGLKWPIPWEEANEPSTGGDAKQISQLQATIKELETKLESLEADNSTLRQQLEARPTASEQGQGVEFLHFTNNLKLVAEVQKNHYSKEPYQKVETIRADMQEKHQISGKLAVAIETVARPDKS